MKMYQSFKKQAGLTLVESLLVLAVAALVAVLAYAGYKMANAGVKSQSSVESTVRLLTAVKKTFGTTNNYTGISGDLVKQSGIVPSDFAISGVFNAPFGSAVTIAPNTDPTMVDITFTSVPADICMDLLAGIEGMTTILQVGTATPKTSGGTYEPATAAAQCGSAVTVIATVK